MERVILVDRNDTELGTAEKLAAHAEARLHRAFSIFVVNAQGELLLQQRSPNKYHSGGLWSNTCCSHPRPGEPTLNAAHRRLMEEMGFDCPLATAFSFVYRADVGGGLVEHELTHVLRGRHDCEPAPNPTEVAGWRWIAAAELRRDLRLRPGAYTTWLRLAVDDMVSRGLF